jgi:hypothetical protein
MADAGKTVLSASQFVPQAGEEQSTCNASFCLERERPGSLDPAYGEGGVIKATQRRCAAFLSAP